MNIPANCVRPTTDPNIKFEENKRVIIFKNPTCMLCQRVQVDGCAITEGKRCDKLLIDWRGDEYYVELKGNDIAKAIEQIMATIPRLHTDGANVRAYIIGTNCSPNYMTKLQKAQKLLYKRYSATLTVREKRHDVTLS